MTLIRATVDEWSSGTSDVVLDVDDVALGADLADALSVMGIRRDRIAIDGRVLPPEGDVHQHPLVHGSIIELGTARPSTDPLDGPHLVVIGGPEAGAWHPIEVGKPVRVGRSEGELRLGRDQLLSRVHAEFAYDGSQVTVKDLQSGNGTEVEGRLVDEPQVIEPGTFVHIGSSTVSVVTISGNDRAPLGLANSGAYPFPRTFRNAQSELAKEVRLPRPPSSDDDSGGSTWWRALLPLVSGIGFAVVTGNFLFLIISALAPLVYAGEAFRQKKKRAQRASSDREANEREAAAATATFHQVALEERRRRREANPMGGTANLFALVRHRRIWERRPQDDDFLNVTVGLATRKSTVTLIDQSEQQRRDQAEMWGSPVNVNLGAMGSLAVLGDRARSRAVLRSLLMGLAVTHAPSDVKVWLFAADDAESEWSAMRWLPHVMQEDATCRIASSRADRSQMLSQLRRVMDGRREVRRSASDGLPLPVHVVVFDGADLMATADVSEVLGDGPALGVIGIVADPRVAPDGTMGTLTLGGAADEATFVSWLEPLIDRVLTAEMPTEWAQMGARRLAGLRPSMAGRGELPAASERLAAMLSSSTVTPEALAAQWAQVGPTTRVAVGTVADSTFSVDIVRDGPHGLVGGMTRSGKTEFLKTLITSLAWANHPDDLSFVIVDFKGGIDYTVANRLPHVLDLSSNQDLDAFERTVQLLSAEQRRRQTIFEQLEVSNLDAYRIERAKRHDLPPIPRLLVLIDEFGELLATDAGRDQLKRIESMSRIGGGLGVNLLLITQNFEGQLPPQIAANAGLRICFRVQEPANSKVVIDSSIAATIGASAKGRGYARLQGGDPTEFQSARVAGRRPDLRGTSTKVSARLQPFGSLMTAFSNGDAPDVPAGETDMFAMIDKIVKATECSGWMRPSVPWPKVLPADLPLTAVLPAANADDVPMGVADVPEKQARRPFAFRPSDEHVALLGGPRADLNTLLTTIACSAAVTHSPDDLHIYAIDFAGRGLARVAGLPHCGGVASRNDALALRIGRHLADEVSIRRSELAHEGVSTLAEYTQRTGKSFPHILLLIAGAERLSSIASTDEQSAAAPPLISLIAEGSGLGVQVIAAGLPGFAQYKPGNLIDRRILFEAADMSDYVPMGCPRRMLSEVRGARRGVDAASGLAVQFCSLAGGTENEADTLDALVHRLREHYAAPLRRPPRRITEVSWPVRLSSMSDVLRERPERMKHPLLLGLSSQTGDPLWVDAATVTGPLFVAGARRSGRSSALFAFGILARHLGWQVLGIAGSNSSPFLEPDCPFTVATPQDADQRIGLMAHPRLVLVDDLHMLDEQDEVAPQRLAEADLVIASGPTSLFSGVQRVLTNREVPRAKAGIVLMPESHEDIDLVGGKSDGTNVGAVAGRRAGQGVFGLNGDLTDVTVPMVDAT